MQKMGSAITYAQRYGLLSIMGLASGIDDDGNEASIKSDVINNNQIDVKNTTDYKKIIEDDKIKKQFGELVKDNKDLFTEEELIIYRNYIYNNQIDNMKNAIVEIQTRIMKG
jgi:hypothetical protein